MKVGLVMGAFSPMHRGHEAILRAAAYSSDHIRVLVEDGATCSIPFDTRKRWVDKFLAKLKLEGSRAKTWTVIQDKTVEGHWTYDSHGSIEQEEYWQKWLEQNKHWLWGCKGIESASLVFGSDRYVGEVASRIGARWYPVDPRREFIRVSATVFRNQPYNYFSWLSNEAAKDLALRIAVVGPESTGKSTLVQALSSYGAVVPEWGRTICEIKPNLDRRDFQWILTQQNLNIEEGVRHSTTGTVITDTEALTTALFSEVYLSPNDSKLIWESAEEVVKNQRIEAYIYLGPTVPLVDDGTRVLDEDSRKAFGNRLLTELQARGKRVFCINTPDFRKREKQASQVVKMLQDEWAEQMRGLRVK